MKIHGEWVDTTSYQRGDDKRVPSIWNFYAGRLRICVHRHIHYPKDQWLLTSEPFYDKWELVSKDIEDAKQEAINLVDEQLHKTISIIRESPTG